MAILVLLNNFLHDFSAAGWLVGTVVLWSILKKGVPLADEGGTVAGVLKTILILMRLSLAGIIIFGLVRAFAYKGYEWNEAAGQSQVTLLIVKHIVFTVIFVPGLVYYIRTAKLIGKVSCEKTQ